MNPSIGFVAGLLLAGTTWAQAPFTVQSKTDVDADLARIIELQDGAAARLKADGGELPLARRTLRPAPGIDALLSHAKSGPSQLVVAQLDDFPSADDRQRWDRQGVRQVSYLGSQFWLLNVRDVASAYQVTGAVSFSSLLPTDKISPALDRYPEQPSFYDDSEDLVVVEVALAEPDARARQTLRHAFHIDGKPFVDDSDAARLSMVMRPQQLEALARHPEVVSILPGQWQQIELMDGVRTTVQGDTVLGVDHVILAGRGIRMATRELMGGGAHADFQAYNGAGEPVGGRWTELAGQSCIGSEGSSWHGQMTAGIMLGNGWNSQDAGGTHLQFRGIAPEGTFECYSQSAARAHVSSHSYVRNYIYSYSNSVDSAILGLSGDHLFHAQTAAAGNNGIDNVYYNEKGYFSILNPHKNQMSVGNSQVNGQIHPTSSLGPTFDGRLKPDISAPTQNWTPDDEKDFAVEIERIRLLRNGWPLYQWTFDNPFSIWHQGWGHTDNMAFGQVFLTVSQTAGGDLGLDIQGPPWGSAWQNSPLVGTQVVPYAHPTGGGDPLNFLGHEDDVLEIVYRSAENDLGFFRMEPQWFRSFPPMNDSDWYSQGNHTAFGIGDGAWRTVRVPVGKALRRLPNSYWPTVETWQDHPIQYLGLRFGGFDYQPVPRTGSTYAGTGGTSGASPVVAGAYALAMEQLTYLHPGVDLDQKTTPSPYAFRGPSLVTGMPWNSTWKSLFIHTAADMVRTVEDADVPNNPDTGLPAVYHRGPDYATGYGMLNIQSTIDLMTLHTRRKSHRIVENEIEQETIHMYPIEVGKDFAEIGGLKVTVVWDDALASDLTDVTALKLVNNLGIVLRDPLGQFYYPWSLDLPYDIHQPGQGPHEIEPEPISIGDITPARRDQPNDRDNVEQIQVDTLSPFQLGTWQLFVVDNGIATLEGQKYSLIISPWNFKKQCHYCKPLLF